MPPGHTSMIAVAPSSLKVSMHRSQRTGLATWPTSRSSTSAPVATVCPSLFETYVNSGSAGVRSAAALASASTAGAMWRVWKAPATLSGTILRTPSGLSSFSTASCSSVPAATIWPAPFTLAGVRPSFSRCATDTSGSPPSSADMPVPVIAAASAMARPRLRTRVSAAVSSRTPAKEAAVISPTLWPATAPGVMAPSAAADRMPAATSSGCATEVSRIASASAWVP